jgi:FkbM family methyltransferase
MGHHPLRPRRSGLVRAAEFAAWAAFALALAGVGTHDAVSRLFADHNSAVDGGYLAMALAWLALAAWAGVRGVYALPAGPGRRRRRWFIAALLLGALPYRSIFESQAAYTLNGTLLLLAFLLLFAYRLNLLAPRREAVPVGSLSTSREHRKRSALFLKAADVMPYVAVEVDDAVFLVSTADRKLGRGLFARRQRNDIDVLARAVQLLDELGVTTAGSTFVDVGANIGTTTVTALRLGFARAVALEPSPSNFLTLRLNLVANGIAEVVTPVEAAASDHEGYEQFAPSPSSSGKGRLASRFRVPPARTVKVECVTLDGLAARGLYDCGAVGLLWVDTQGREGRVLAGAASLLREGVPIVTAVRRSREDHDLLRRSLAGYDEFFDLRTGQRGALEALLALLDRSTDILALPPSCSS